MPRPLKTINWDLVEKQMEAKCSAREIAGSLHIEINTFYDRFKLEYGKGFADLADDFHSGGKGNIKIRQYAKAMEGNNQMLIWLGKQWLGQKEFDDTKGLPPNDGSINQLIVEVREQRQKDASEPKADPELQRSE